MLFRFMPIIIIKNLSKLVQWFPSEMDLYVLSLFIIKMYWENDLNITIENYTEVIFPHNLVIVHDNASMHGVFVYVSARPEWIKVFAIIMVKVNNYNSKRFNKNKKKSNREIQNMAQMKSQRLPKSPVFRQLLFLPILEIMKLKDKMNFR